MRKNFPETKKTTNPKLTFARDPGAKSAPIRQHPEEVWIPKLVDNLPYSPKDDAVLNH